MYLNISFIVANDELHVFCAISYLPLHNCLVSYEDAKADETWNSSATNGFIL